MFFCTVGALQQSILFISIMSKDMPGNITILLVAGIFAKGGMNVTNEDEIQQNGKTALEYQVNVLRKDSFEVYMDNKRTTLEDALERGVWESSVYMPDYVLDENGNLKQVRFDRIKM